MVFTEQSICPGHLIGQATTETQGMERIRSLVSFFQGPWNWRAPYKTCTFRWLCRSGWPRKCRAVFYFLPKPLWQTPSSSTSEPFKCRLRVNCFGFASPFHCVQKQWTEEADRNQVPVKTFQHGFQPPKLRVQIKLAIHGMDSMNSAALLQSLCHIFQSRRLSRCPREQNCSHGTRILHHPWFCCGALQVTPCSASITWRLFDTISRKKRFRKREEPY
jgi:hypothetical protein